MKTAPLATKSFSIPKINFKYIFKNVGTNEVIFTNKILTNNWVMLNISPNKITTYEQLVMLHN